MVSLRKWSRNGSYHYSLEHSLRKDRKVVKRAKYLGQELPKDLHIISEENLREIYRELWFDDFYRIRDGYQGGRSKISLSGLEKEIIQFGTMFTYNTNRIEGSTQTFKETANLLESGITPDSRMIWELKEAESHREAYEEILIYPSDLSLDAILYFHRKLFSKTKKDIAGKIRDH